MRFVIRPAAKEDIIRQFRYYVDADSPAAANRFMDSVENSISKICRMPGMGAPRSFEHPSLHGLRSWPVKGFAEIRIYYVIEEDAVRVIRVLHGKRDLQQVLSEQ